MDAGELIGNRSAVRIDEDEVDGRLEALGRQIRVEPSLRLGDERRRLHARWHPGRKNALPPFPGSRLMVQKDARTGWRAGHVRISQSASGPARYRAE